MQAMILPLSAKFMSVLLRIINERILNYERTLYRDEW